MAASRAALGEVIEDRQVDRELWLLRMDVVTLRRAAATATHRRAVRTGLRSHRFRGCAGPPRMEG
ncbi:hypothetical protein ACH47V_08270 [Micromonospora chersina]|uniref:hypothetical protein n=1 Tax=Micromonospora chersina TaxID=47854 RepID=UPI003406703C